MPEQATVYKLIEAEGRAQRYAANDARARACGLKVSPAGVAERDHVDDPATELLPMTAERIAELFDEACWIVTGEEKFYPDFPDTPRPRPLASDAHLVALMHLIALAGKQLEVRR